MKTAEPGMSRRLGSSRGPWLQAAAPFSWSDRDRAPHAECAREAQPGGSWPDRPSVCAGRERI